MEETKGPRKRRPRKTAEEKAADGALAAERTAIVMRAALAIAKALSTLTPAERARVLGAAKELYQGWAILT